MGPLHQGAGRTTKVESHPVPSCIALPRPDLNHSQAVPKSLSLPLFFPFSPPPTTEQHARCPASPHHSVHSTFLDSKQAGLGNGEVMKAGSFADRLTFGFWGFPKYPKVPQTRWFSVTETYCFSCKGQKPKNQGLSRAMFSWQAPALLASGNSLAYSSLPSLFPWWSHCAHACVPVSPL